MINYRILNKYKFISSSRWQPNIFSLQMRRLSWRKVFSKAGLPYPITITNFASSPKPVKSCKSHKPSNSALPTQMVNNTFWEPKKVHWRKKIPEIGFYIFRWKFRLWPQKKEKKRTIVRRILIGENLNFKTTRK